MSAGSFPCTSCGACCRMVMGRAAEILKTYNGINVRPDGSCEKYIHATKQCSIYDARPLVCRVDELRPEGTSVADWHAEVEAHCDITHRIVYGAERERGVECMHEENPPSLQLQLETVSTCNARCHFCTYPATAAQRAGGIMTMALFRKIVNETAPIAMIRDYVLHGLGEPLLDPMLVQRVNYIRFLKPASTIEIYTNGVSLNPHRFEELKAAGLTSLVVSLNAVSPAQHEAIMGLKDKFDVVCANLDYALANRGDVNIQVHAVINGDKFTQLDKDIFHRRWGHRDSGGAGICVWEGNWTGDNRTVRGFKANECCDRAIGQIYVTYDGKVTACCFDPTGKMTFGDLNTQSLRDIYRSDAYLKFREDHFNNEADKHAICASCTRI